MDFFSRANMVPASAAFLIILTMSGLCEAHITYIEAKAPLVGSPPPPGSPWPKPQFHASYPTLYELRPESFNFVTSMTGCELIEKAIVRYRDLIFLQNTVPIRSKLPRLYNLTIILLEKDDCAYPEHGMDESYTLVILERFPRAVLKSKTPWGILRGLETFSQLIYMNETTNQYLINATSVWDWPRFGFRGVHLDTARHFLPLKVIKQNLASTDAMAYNKFNVFHWHIVDDQSWPYQMKVFPNLTYAAYHPKLIYTRQDVQDIIEYARERGIRVIPEIDTPGHTQALGRVFPDILTPCYDEDGKGKPKYPFYAGHEMLNPMQDYTYWVVYNILKEVKMTFPDNYIHLGMDEVYYDCWHSSPEIQQFMIHHNMSLISEVEEYYVRKTLNNAKSLGAKYMIWQDPLDNGVKPETDTVIGVWRNTGGSWEDYLAQAVNYGYQIVLSTPWYLNYIEYGQDWQKYYAVDPRAFNATEKQRQLIIGGEACMWGEFVDGTNVISIYWPRASAVGERLWSAVHVNDPEEAKWRLDEHRCRMVSRGIPAAPILNGYCGAYDWGV
ncbi:beta-hexosaminidase subunit beta-like [Tropilaelaps mercedesae]|uniref:Beta-hexosaminidase n=1 Tax=Tropilaelaps mercedesae TaxID=418985 RepID=A0A1V9XMY4_9ACAR|nr:beta-hexosaminidase subunit beta-like [Tropilaelaps mercedesae]